MARSPSDDRPNRPSKPDTAPDLELLAAGDERANRDERTAGQRDGIAQQRNDNARARLTAAEQRDAIADDRDVAALARDRLATAGDVAIAETGATGTDAAEHRVEAAEGRLLAARDRKDAARERRRSLVDREMLVAELRREHELRDEATRHQHRAEKLARTLQRSLSPPSLPPIAGLDVAVYHEPAAPEEVGGDFYDLFALREGRTGFFLGDVCGKGPEAAAVTSLARYTMRTAAMLHECPEAILAELNAALLMDSSETMHTCTAVYGQIDTNAGAVTVTLAVAGHPSPLIVRADGSVEVAPARGTMLGAVEDPVFDTCAMQLAPGDAIVLSSDGILDVRLDGIRLDERRVAALLSGISHASAEQLVQRLVNALLEVDRPLCDDVAILALRRT